MNYINIKNILIIYKKTQYESILKNKNKIKNSYIINLLFNHNTHYNCLQNVIKFLNKIKKPYLIIPRKYLLKNILKKKMFIISIGGDGTVLSTSHFISNGSLFGINSSPKYSVGLFCAANNTNFKKYIIKYLNKKIKQIIASRIKVFINGNPFKYLALNEILITNKSPANISIYSIKKGNIYEKHKNSGIWISTAFGSTGASKSSGGYIMNLKNNDLQFRTRETYYIKKHIKKYKLLYGIIKPLEYLYIISLNKNMKIFFDGTYIIKNISFGNIIKIFKNSKTLKIMVSKKMLNKRQRYFFFQNHYTEGGI